MTAPAERVPLDLGRPRSVHIVGIGGAGMSAIAVVLRAMGHSVSGSDLKNSAVVDRLRSQGISVSVGHRPENLGEADAVTYSPAVAASNPEIRAAHERGVRLVPRSEILAAICATRLCLAVAGTKGKTTTASMLSLILVEAGWHPSFVIGADVNEIGTNAVWDTGEWLVVEADESYGTFGVLRPDLAVLTNVEPDHLDHYGTFAELAAAFDSFIGSAHMGAIVCADDGNALDIGRRHQAATVGTSVEALYQMTDVSVSRSAVSFQLGGPDQDVGRLAVGVPGLHNARNAALAAVAALRIGVPAAAIRRALARFTGVSRRFEFRGETGGVTFVDDYAHLPFAVEAVLSTARAGGWSRVVAVFQPHRYTRTAELAEQFGPAFAEADILIVTDVYGAGEAPIPGVSGRLVADAVRAQDPRLPVTYVGNWDELRRVVASVLQPGDLCLTLGAGDLTVLPDDLLSSAPW
jgi:UDP-N-acetylmuramate--alanine ligase